LNERALKIGKALGTLVIRYMPLTLGTLAVFPLVLKAGQSALFEPGY